MHQFIIWTALEDAGFGASLQYYNLIIDEVVAKEFKIDVDWKLRARILFGVSVGESGEKIFGPLEEWLLFLK